MNRPRAYYRHQRERAKARALRVIAGWPKDATPELLGRLTNTRTLCSCDMCGNPRRHWKRKPMQERKVELAEQVEDEQLQAQIQVEDEQLQAQIQVEDEQLQAHIT